MDELIDKIFLGSQIATTKYDVNFKIGQLKFGFFEEMGQIKFYSDSAEYAELEKVLYRFISNKNQNEVVNFGPGTPAEGRGGEMPDYTGAGGTSIHKALDDAREDIAKAPDKARQLLEELRADLMAVEQASNEEEALASLMDKWNERYPSDLQTDLLINDMPTVLNAVNTLLHQAELALGNGGLALRQSSGQAGSLSIPGNKKPGGIDFRALPVQNLGTELPHLRGVPHLAGVTDFDLEAEWRKIEDLVNQGDIPSAESIKEYIQASCLKGSADKDMDRVLSCIADILRLEEDFYIPTEPLLIDILTAVESANSLPQLKAAFIDNL